VAERPANPLFDFEHAHQLISDQVNPLDGPAWIKKTFDVDLWSKQKEIINALDMHKKVAVKSGHGVGKSFTAAIVAARWIATHPADETLVVTTAPSARQVHAILWEDIRKLHRKGNLSGEVQRSDNWLIGNTLVGFGRKPQDYDRHAFQGLHRKYVLVVIDEACGIDEWLWIAALAITTGAHCRILAIGNPDDPTSYFSKVCKPQSGWHTIKISVLDSPNFTGEKGPEVWKDTLTDQSYLEDMRREVGEDSPMWTSKVLGEFPEIDEFSVIPLGWVLRAQERWQDWMDAGAEIPEGTAHIIGADIARFGLDKTAFAHRYGDVVTEVTTMPKLDTVGTALRLKELLKPSELAVVDTNGVGAGVYDHLRHAGYYCLPFNAGTRTTMTDSSGQIEFYNHRSAAMWRLREALDPARGSTICIPAPPPGDTKNELANDLSAPRWKNIAGGKIVIEDKTEIKKRIGRSTDRGDAVMMAFWANRAGIVEDTSEAAFSWRDVKDSDDPSDCAVEWDEPDMSDWELAHG
jgi:hypothetical protein